MKINEITINDGDLVFETLISNIATTVAGLFLDIKFITNDFSIVPQDVLSVDEIAEIIHNLKPLLAEATNTFDENSQTIMLLTALLNYFNTGF